jgi:D-alanyl-D-alanine carboxypeptidase
MKKIYIQSTLIFLTILFLGIIAFYYLQWLKIDTISNSQEIVNKENTAEEIISELTPTFDEPIFEANIQVEKETTFADSEVKKIIQKQQEISNNILEEDIRDTEKNHTWELSHPTFLIDVYSDSSIQKFIGNYVSFYDLSYIPENLVSLSWSYIIDAKWNGQIRKEALEKFEKLSQSFFVEFSEKIVVVSSYRSYAYQKWIKDRGCPDNLCAKAWYSEHQSWLAVDFWEASTNSQFLGKAHLKKYYEWLMKNASSYWFHNSYQKWKAIDWYDIEPWHWRFVWEKLAKYLEENNLTFTEFYNIPLKDEA